MKLLLEGVPMLDAASRTGFFNQGHISRVLCFRTPSAPGDGVTGSLTSRCGAGILYHAQAKIVEPDTERGALSAIFKGKVSR